jgi:hypothetical protein
MPVHWLRATAEFRVQSQAKTPREIGEKIGAGGRDFRMRIWTPSKEFVHICPQPLSTGLCRGLAVALWALSRLSTSVNMSYPQQSQRLMENLPIAFRFRVF